MRRWIAGWIALSLGLAAAAWAQPARAQDADEQVRAVVAEYQDDAAQAYGLEFRQAVEGRAQNREEFGEYLRRKSEEQMPPEKLRGTQVLLVRFGLVPEDFDLISALQELFGAMAMGYYDPEDNVIRVLTPLPDASLMQETMVHELIHALQDQHFDLGTLIQNAMREDDDDKTAALRFLWEGEATLFTLLANPQVPREMVGAVLGMMRRMTRDLYVAQIRMAAGMMGAQTAEMLREAADAVERMPPVFFRMATDPYFLGSYALHQVYQARGIEGMRTLWRSPPQSTRDILHADLLLQEGGPPAPKVVRLGALGDALGEGWTSPLSGTLGAWTLALTFEGRGGALDQMTRGWRGDAYQVWTRGDDDFVAGHFAFADVEAARAFAQALENRYRRTLVAGREIAEAPISGAPEGVVSLDADGFRLLIERRESDVAFALGSGFDGGRLLAPLRAGRVEDPRPVEHH